MKWNSSISALIYKRTQKHAKNEDAQKKKKRKHTQQKKKTQNKNKDAKRKQKQRRKFFENNVNLAVASTVHILDVH